MTYKNAAALEMAVKAVVSTSDIDTNRAISSFYFHRLLCWVFAYGNNAFVLKDDQSVLARRLFDPVLTGFTDGMAWNPQKTAWEEFQLNLSFEPVSRC